MTAGVCLEHGTGLVEFSFLILVLMLLVFGVADFALAIEQGIVVSAAAHAGAEFGAAEGNANNTAGMQTAAVNAAVGIPSFTASASTWCTCTANGSVVSCASTCNTYDIPMQYVQVQTSVTIGLFFKFPGIPASVSIANGCTLRAK